MIDLIIIRYLHFLGIFGVIGTLVTELFMVQRSMSRREISRMARIDGIYGLSAIMVLLAGLTMWFWVGKPSAFYTHNWIFHTKVGLFVIVGLLSIFPTIFFIRHRKGEPDEKVTISPMIINMIRMEVLLLFIIPILAIMMANGVGLSQ